MLVIARFYAADVEAAAAVNAAVEAGFQRNSMVLIAPPSRGDELGEGGRSISMSDVAEAMRAGGMLGDNAEFYAARLQEGNTLLVMNPPIIGSGAAERILDEHNPLDISHLSKPEPFVPISLRLGGNVL